MVVRGVMNVYTEEVWRFLASSRGMAKSLRVICRDVDESKRIHFVGRYLKKESLDILKSVPIDAGTGGLSRRLLMLVAENEVNWSQVAAFLLTDHENN
jgi:hypothetical protein